MFRALIITLILSVSAMPLLAGPDPMRPPAISKPVQSPQPMVQAGQWRLSLIRQQGSTRTALINGRLVRVGSQVDGARVAAIGRQQAILKLPDARSIKLELPSLQLKKDNN